MPEATITEIMESWPLGLRLRIEGERSERLVDLSEDCVIVEGPRALAPSDLQPGMRIRLADFPDPVVRRVEVLAPGP